MILLSTVPYLNLNVSSVYSFGKVCVVVNELRFCCDIFLDGRSVINTSYITSLIDVVHLMSSTPVKILTWMINDWDQFIR